MTIGSFRSNLSGFSIREHYVKSILLGAQRSATTVSGSLQFFGLATLVPKQYKVMNGSRAAHNSSIFRSATFRIVQFSS